MTDVYIHNSKDFPNEENSILIETVFIGAEFPFKLKKNEYQLENIVIFKARNKDEMDVLCIGLGEKKDITAQKIRSAAGIAAQVLRKEKYSKAYISCESMPVEGISENLLAFLEGIRMGHYKYIDCLGEKSRKESEIKLDVMVLPDTRQNHLENTQIESIINLSKTNADGVCFARDLVNAPSNHIYPKSFADKMTEHFRGTNVNVKVYNASELIEEKFVGLMAVGRGSVNPPCYVKLEYIANQKKLITAFVGKGITFDMGGMNIKIGNRLSGSRMDMGGAAAVAGAFDIISKTNPDANLIGLIPLAENMISGNAVLPSEVLEYPNGTTVEIGNTDAEGRLVLADAILHAQRLGAKIIIDAATLTGNVGAALGPKLAGIWGNDEICTKISEIGESVGNKVWRMPLVDEYIQNIKSEYADIWNVATSDYAGAITAALFLKHFVKEGVSWAHIDIAATAQTASAYGFNPSGATGFGVRIFSEIAEN